MISYATALDMIKNAGTAGGCLSIVEDVPLAQACGRIGAADLIARSDVQPFDNSAMDGYAVRLSDFSQPPYILEISQTLAAGDVPSSTPHRAGTCAAIMTGAMVPPWAEAIVPVEQVAARPGGRLEFGHPPLKGEHIRRRGQDFRAGETISLKGVRLTTGHILAAAALGYSHIPVFCLIKGAFIATGRELEETSAHPLPPAKIHNCNLPYGMAQLATMGVSCVTAGTVHDNPEEFSEYIKSAREAGCRLIVSSGAVSTGRFDFVRAALEALGAEILFHKVAIKPGKPVLFARLPEGAFYFGLPGNPAATAVGLRFFVRPFVEAGLGSRPDQPLYAQLDTDFRKSNALRLFLKARATSLPDGRLAVSLLEGQESFMTHPFLAMNAWAILPEEPLFYEKGSSIEVCLPYS